MALRMWASSTANALRISYVPSNLPFPSFSRCFSTVLDGLKYASSHEWVKHEGSVATIGITDHAQSANRVSAGFAPLTLLSDLARSTSGPNCFGRVYQDHLGEVVFVELPEAGASVSKGGSFGAVESVKATSDINSPISGEVIEVNTKLTESPGLINSSPYEEGWMIKLKPSSPSELNSLMGSKEYTKFCEEDDAGH